MKRKLTLTITKIRRQVFEARQTMLLLCPVCRIVTETIITGDDRELCEKCGSREICPDCTNLSSLLCKVEGQSVKTQVCQNCRSLCQKN